MAKGYIAGIGTGGSGGGNGVIADPEAVSTSLIAGGVMTQNTATSIDISAGNGRVVSIDGAGISTITPFSWVNQTNVTITNIGTQADTRFAFDINGVVAQLPITLTPEVARDYVNIGVVTHGQGVISNVVNTSLKDQEIYSQIVDILTSLGVTRRNGLSVSPNANLTFNKAAGELQSLGVGNNAGTVGQNIVRIAEETPAVFATLLGITGNVTAVGQTSLDPAFYDSGTGTKTAIGTPLAQSTIFYVHQAIIGPLGLFVSYGQTVYPTLNDAVLGAEREKPIQPEALEQGTNLIARFAVRSDATNLQDTAQAVLLGGVKFGSHLW